MPTTETLYTSNPTNPELHEGVLRDLRDAQVRLVTPFSEREAKVEETRKKIRAALRRSRKKSR